MTDGVNPLDILQTLIAGAALAAGLVAALVGVLRLGRGSVYLRAHGLTLLTGAGGLLAMTAIAIENGAGLIAAKALLVGVLACLFGLAGGYVVLRAAQDLGVEPEAGPSAESDR